MVRSKTPKSKRNLKSFQPTPLLSRAQIKKSTKKGLPNKWSEADYSSLVMLVRQYGEDWPVIASKFPYKTAKQCMQKFKNSQRSAKKGNWASEEDEILLKWVKDFGPTKWTESSKLIRGRCGKQCRERWVNILNPHVKKGNWGEDEQKMIFENLRVHQTSWSSMSRALPGRTENSIKNYFYSSLRRLKSNSLCMIVKEMYVDKSIDFKSAMEKYPFIDEELGKFNTLSQQICAYLLGREPKDENFVRFLVSVIFCEDQLMPAPPFTKNSIEVKHNNINKRAETPIYIPHETNKHVSSHLGAFKENDTKSVIGVLKKMVNQVNKPGLISVINFLENQLVNNDAENVIERKDNNVRIRLPFCWNCKTKTCNLHRKS